MTEPTILVINAGSSSIKFAVFTTGMVERLKGGLEGIGTLPHFIARDGGGSVVADDVWSEIGKEDVQGLIQRLIAWLDIHMGTGTLAAIGHRVAIGGLAHSRPSRVTPALLGRLRELAALAPLHQPRNIEPIESLLKSHPQVPQVACYDTAFHRTLPHVAQMYALPKALRDAGACRYGFHGLSYEYITGKLAETNPQIAKGRVVVAHLGSGASLCALKDGKSIATTMGFSPLSGLVMATRPGDLDPGLMIWLARERGLSPDDLEAMLYHDSGLKGVSGLSGDMRDLLASPTTEARQAVELFVYRVSTELGALAAALGGLDALVFTAGIGENAASVRNMICERAAWLGIEIDEVANRHNALRISKDDSAVAALVIPTDEELMVACHTVQLTQHEARNSK